MADISPERAQGTNADWRQHLYNLREAEVWKNGGIDHDFPFNPADVLSVTLAYNYNWTEYAYFVQFKDFVMRLKNSDNEQEEEEGNLLLHVLFVDLQDAQKIVSSMSGYSAWVYIPKLLSFQDEKKFCERNLLEFPIQVVDIWRALEKEV